MRDHDDLPYIVIEKDSGGGTGAFVLGALIGAGLALLFAPQSGEETQEEIRAKAKELKGAAEDRLRNAQRDLEDRLDTARQEVRGRVDAVKDAVDSGRDAAREKRADLENKLERSKAAYRAGVAAAKEAAKAPAEDEEEA